jgi:hypothetical protein
MQVGIEVLSKIPAENRREFIQSFLSRFYHSLRAAGTTASITSYLRMLER